MLTLTGISAPHIQFFFMVFLRVGAFLLVIPPFDSSNIPIFVKIGLSLAVASLLFGLLTPGEPPAILPTVPFCLAAACELIRGLVLGFCLKLIFAAIQMAGEVLAVQMGFSMGSVIDPLLDAQVSPMAQINNILALLLFMAMDGHHGVIRALVGSFQSVPLFVQRLPEGLGEEILRMGTLLYLLAVRIAAPIVVALLLTTVALGLLARIIPQMNIFMVAFSLKIGIGILFLMVCLPFMSGLLTEIFAGLTARMMGLIGALSPK